MSKLFQARFIATFLMAAASLPTSAGLTNDLVETTLRSNSGFGSFSLQTVVGPNEEGGFFGSVFFDYGNNSLSIRSTKEVGGMFSSNPKETVSLVLTSLDMGAPIGEVNVTTALQGVRTSFTGNSITFSWNEQFIPVGTYLSAQVSSVPEPTSALLLTVGIAGIAAARRRQAGCTTN